MDGDEQDQNSKPSLTHEAYNKIVMDGMVRRMREKGMGASSSISDIDHKSEPDDLSV